TLSGDYMLRGIAGVDWFFNETEGEMEKLPYRLDLHDFNLQLSHFFSGGYSYGSVPRNELAIHLLSGFEKYNANLLLESYGLPVFSYNISNAFKAGTMGTFSSTVIEPTQYIAPRGIVSRIQFNLCKLRSLKEENSFDASGKEQYNDYLFYEVQGHAKAGMKTLWAERHTFHFDIKSTLLKIIKQDTTFPSYYLPGEWIPGYSYYYRDTRIVETEANPASVQSFDTLLVTGKAVIRGEISYRFPLSPKLIDKKLSFLYLERIYGAFNFNFGAGWDNPQDFFRFSRKDWLFAYGAEVRIETISFYSYPFDIKIRWDYGADRPTPLGGHRFTFSIAYDFDNWDLVLSPDYYKRKTPTP
ncbi:MAG: hypothetical protein N2053_12700, partial [Chitinispirillaceae bacterium]|nr:hypothetical protein [Chitinispirillaceae bacterium]